MTGGRGLPAGLGTRDIAILADVGRFRFSTSDQLIRLNFTTGSTIGRQRRGQRVLHRLNEDGYLQRLPRRVGGPWNGSARHVYELGYRGQRQLWPQRPARTPAATTTLFVAHCLAAAEVIVELVEHQQIGTCTDLVVETEPRCWRRWTGSHGRPLTLKPDLAVRLATGDIRRVWFVEVDRATHAPSRVLAKAHEYLRYWRTGIEQEHLGTFPRVLFSVPTDQRSAALHRALDGLREPAAAMFMIATAEATAAVMVNSEINQLRGGNQ